MCMHLQEEFVFHKSFELGSELEEMQGIYDQILRKRQLNSRANVNHLWKLLQVRVDRCVRIKQEIGAAGASSQEIPPEFIK